MRISPAELDRLADYVRRETGITLDHSKDYLFESRLKPVIERFKLHTFHGLHEALVRGNHGPELREAFIDAMTTGETSFFRDGRPFDLLRHKLVPDLLGANPRARIRIWSAACSTGQEIYSIAMALQDILFDFRRYDVQLLGTDISEEAVTRASRAEYSEFEVGRGLDARRIEKHFVKRGARYVVADELRGICSFRKHNLLVSSGSIGPFEVVFCRNVACYFEADVRRRLYENLAHTLVPGGSLIVGVTDSLAGLSNRFERMEFHGAVYYRRIA